MLHIERRLCVCKVGQRDKPWPLSLCYVPELPDKSVRVGILFYRAGFQRLLTFRSVPKSPRRRDGAPWTLSRLRVLPRSEWLCFCWQRVRWRLIFLMCCSCWRIVTPLVFKSSYRKYAQQGAWIIIFSLSRRRSLPPLLVWVLVSCGSSSSTECRKAMRAEPMLSLRPSPLIWRLVDLPSCAVPIFGPVRSCQSVLPLGLTGFQGGGGVKGFQRAPSTLPWCPPAPCPLRHGPNGWSVQPSRQGLLLLTPIGSAGHHGPQSWGPTSHPALPCSSRQDSIDATVSSMLEKVDALALFPYF